MTSSVTERKPNPTSEIADKTIGSERMRESPKKSHAANRIRNNEILDEIGMAC